MVVSAWMHNVSTLNLAGLSTKPTLKNEEVIEHEITYLLVMPCSFCYVYLHRCASKIIKCKKVDPIWNPPFLFLLSLI